MSSSPPHLPGPAAAPDALQPGSHAQDVFDALPAPAPLAPPMSIPSPWLKSWAILVTFLAGVALLVSILLWQKLDNIQQELARRSLDSGSQATEARTLARQAEELSRELAARLALQETRVSEVSLQRTQLEELMQSLSRSRDENLVVDTESALRLAQQQALPTAAREVASGSVAAPSPAASAASAGASGWDGSGFFAQLQPALWLQRTLDALQDEARKLLRVSRIDQPEAALLAPEQSFFLRENLKLRLLNARLSLLSRQTEAARSDLVQAGVWLNKYFDGSSRKTQTAMQLLQQVQGQLKTSELPRLDETMTALATAAAGR